MAKNVVAQKFTPNGYFFTGDNDYLWDMFVDPSRRTQLQERRMRRTLWSITPVNHEDGKYYGDAVINGYHVVRKVLEKDGLGDLVG